MHAKTPLLWVLRDVARPLGTKFGCGAGFCAACTVLIDGRNTKACQTRTEQAVGKTDHDGRGSVGPRGSTRCATPGTAATSCSAVTASPGRRWRPVVAARVGPSPDDDAIDEWMSGNLCRCGTYPRIREAIHEAAGDARRRP